MYHCRPMAMSLIEEGQFHDYQEACLHQLVVVFNKRRKKIETALETRTRGIGLTCVSSEKLFREKPDD